MWTTRTTTDKFLDIKGTGWIRASSISAVLRDAEERTVTIVAGGMNYQVPVPDGTTTRAVADRIIKSITEEN